MSWSFDSTDLSSNLNKVRREIGDVLESDPLLTDEEITQALADEGSVLLAAARACDWIGRTFARDFDFEADGTKVMKAARAKQFRDLATDLRTRSAIATSGTGGIGVVQTRNVDGYQPYSNPTVDHRDLTGLV